MGGEKQAKLRGVTKSIARGADGNYRFLKAITGLRAGNKTEGGNEYVR
jgi:hypothetical protein